MTEKDRMLIESIPAALSETERVCASVNVGTKPFRHQYGCGASSGGEIKELSEKTGNADSIGCAKLVVFCNAAG